jgi:hypothetical protein
MDPYFEGMLHGEQWERSEIVTMLRGRADKALASGQEEVFDALSSAAWTVEGRFVCEYYSVRVRQFTGLALKDIPVGDPADMLAGHIIAHDQATGEWCFYTGYPTHEDDDGVPQWDVSSARKVKL